MRAMQHNARRGAGREDIGNIPKRVQVFQHLHTLALSRKTKPPTGQQQAITFPALDSSQVVGKPHEHDHRSSKTESDGV